MRFLLPFGLNKNVGSKGGQSPLTYWTHKGATQLGLIEAIQLGQQSRILIDNTHSNVCASDCFFPWTINHGLSTMDDGLIHD